MASELHVQHFLQHPHLGSNHHVDCYLLDNLPVLRTTRGRTGNWAMSYKTLSTSGDDWTSGSLTLDQSRGT